VNAKDSFDITPLHLACQAGNLEGVNKFICDADITMKDSNGDTPLHEACHHGKKEIVELLLSKMKTFVRLKTGSREKKINVMINCRNRSGLTPFHLACRGGHLEIAQKLHNDSDKPEELVTEKDTKGATALHLACQKDQPSNVDVVDFLLSKEADILAQKNDGMTPVHTAAEHGCVEVMKSLLEYDKGIGVNDRDRYEQTPLHFAAEHGKVEMIQLLLDE
jgi:ankyrin repeat protein